MNHQVNMAQFIAPKSDQLNSDDLIGGPRTIRITGVSANEGSPEQPVSISFEGDDRKPFKPCKSMRRVMVTVWGPDASKYVGRAMTIYRDPKVQFGGMQVGGIRISHMSDITEKMTMALTASKAKRAPFTVLPLANNDAVSPNVLTIDRARNDIEAAADLDELKSIWTRKSMAPHRTELQADLDKRKAELSNTVSDEAPHAEEGRATDDMGEGFNDEQPKVDEEAPF